MMRMDKFAFVSRHEPTNQQRETAARMNVDLEWVGDKDGFALSAEDLYDLAKYRGVIAVHAGMVAELMSRGFTVGVFQNVARPADGDRPSFEPGKLHVWHGGHFR